MDEYCSTSVFCADGVRLIMTAANRKQPVAQHQHSRPAGIDLGGSSSDWAVQEQAYFTANLCEPIYESLDWQVWEGFVTHQHFSS